MIFFLHSKQQSICLLKEFICNVLALWQAKALAEKNMRDLLAQREQAERNVIIFWEAIPQTFILLCIFHVFNSIKFFLQRLAETLDADVKMWSNGKEGNLRALLSTLQYVCCIVLAFFRNEEVFWFP